MMSEENGKPIQGSDYQQRLSRTGQFPLVDYRESAQGGFILAHELGHLMLSAAKPSTEEQNQGVLSQFLTERCRVHETYVREDQRTTRVRLYVSGACFIAASIIAVFAPTGRESIGYGVGAALAIIAAGIVGFKGIKAAWQGMSLEAGDVPPASSPEKKSDQPPTPS